MPVCDQTLKDENETVADQANPRILYHDDVKVTVTARNPTDNTITFTALGANGNTVTCTEKWGEREIMWAACPSELSSVATPDDPGPVSAVGNQGLLYLSESFVAANGILALPPPKWPKNLPAEEFYNQISIRPKHIHVTVGITVGGNATDVVLDLLDPEVARRAQTLVLGDRPLHLRLSASAFGDLGVPFGAPAEEWPWAELESSVAVMKNAASDLNALAYAWTVVALCIGRLEVDSVAGLVKDRHKNALVSILPDHPSVTAFTNPV